MRNLVREDLFWLLLGYGGIPIASHAATTLCKTDVVRRLGLLGNQKMGCSYCRLVDFWSGRHLVASCTAGVHMMGGGAQFNAGSIGVQPRWHQSPLSGDKDWRS
jgi:hypothetical protein